MHTVTLNKSRATWNYFTRYAIGGGFGSNYCGPQYIALMRATDCIKPGEQYHLIINGKDKGIKVKS